MQNAEYTKPGTATLCTGMSRLFKNPRALLLGCTVQTTPPSFNRHDGISLLLPLQARAFLRAQLEELVCLRGAPGKLDNFVLQDGKGCEGEEEGAGLC